MKGDARTPAWREQMGNALPPGYAPSESPAHICNRVFSGFTMTTGCPGCQAEANAAWRHKYPASRDEVRFLLSLAKYAPAALICDDRLDDGSCGGDCGAHRSLADIETRLTESNDNRPLIPDPGDRP